MPRLAGDIVKCVIDLICSSRLIEGFSKLETNTKCSSLIKAGEGTLLKLLWHRDKLNLRETFFGLEGDFFFEVALILIQPATKSFLYGKNASTPKMSVASIPNEF